MKKGVLILLVLLLIGTLYALPTISFNSPTPSNNYETTASGVIIKSMITGVDDLLDFVFSWDGVNYSLYDDSLILMLNLNNNSEIGEDDSLVVDVSRRGHNGTVVGGASPVSSGKYGGGYLFDSDSEYINFSDSEDFRNENFTISFWYAKNSNEEIKEISVFGVTSCILFQKGRVYCVGDNEYGQLGDGTTTDSSLFVRVSGENNFTSFCQEDYSGSHHICGLLQNGTGLCWGDNSNGKLGDGTTTQRETPTPISGNYNFSNLYCGRYNTCGLLQNGTGLCWGRNDQGQVGDNTTTQRETPTPVFGNYTFKALTTGDGEQCGLLENGSALCWGRNDHGQVGDNTTTYRYFPTFVHGAHNFSKIFAGNEKVCALLENGSAMCWGNQASGGSLECMGGLGTNDCVEHRVPHPVYGDYLYEDLEAYYYGYIGLLKNGSVVGWGLNNMGQIGDGSSETKLKPVFSKGDEIFNKISVGFGAVFAVTKEGKIFSWGGNTEGVTGKGKISGFFPLPILFYHGDISQISYSRVASGGSHTCSLNYQNKIYCWGKNTYGQLGDNTTTQRETPTPVFGDYNFSSLFLGGSHSCGLLENGTALCWGLNDYGQLGDNTTTQRETPTPVFGDYNFTKLDLGDRHTCGLLENGTVLCWGDNSYGQLGDNTTTRRDSPTFVNGNYNFSSISSGGLWFTCGILTNGSAMCWGRNNVGQLGNGSFGGSSKVPVFVNGIYNFSSITSGTVHSCGILTNGSAMCWGLNSLKALGDNTTTNREIPTSVFGDNVFSFLESGNRHNCGVLQNGTLLCWGRNNFGQLGDGTLLDKEFPVSVKINEAFNSITLGGFHSLGVLSDGRIVSWGSNSDSQQAFSNLDLKIPTKGVYKGKLLGRDSDSFEIGTTFSGDLKFQTNYGFENLELEEGYNYLTLSYDGEDAKVYLNGELNSSFDPPGFSYPTEYLDFLIGNGGRGSIDEVRMWNRTLSDEEIEQVYRSNLKKINQTAWEFEVNQTLDEDKTYKYIIYAIDSIGQKSLWRNIIKYTQSTVSYSGSGPSIYYAKPYQLKKGYGLFLNKGKKVNLNLSDNKVREFRVNSVNISLEEISFSLEEENYTMSSNESLKVDFDGDGYYDLEVNVKSVKSNGYAKLEFKEIREEVPASQKDAVEEEVKEEEERIGFFKKFWNWIKKLFGF